MPKLVKEVFFFAQNGGFEITRKELVVLVSESSLGVVFFQGNLLFSILFFLGRAAAGLERLFPELITQLDQFTLLHNKLHFSLLEIKFSLHAPLASAPNYLHVSMTKTRLITLKVVTCRLTSSCRSDSHPHSPYFGHGDK